MKTVLDREDLLLNPVELGCVLSLTGLPGGSNKIYDRSPYGNTGTIVGATWVRLPSGLWVLSFDGSDDHVNCGNCSSLAPSEAITIEAWVKVDKTKLDWSGMIASRAFTDKAEDNYLFDVVNTGYLRFNFYNGAWRAGTADTSRDVGDVKWHHVAVTYNRTIYAYYVDGKRGDNPTATYALLGNGHANYIGRSYYQPQMNFEGLIGLPRIYNRALSALEIQNTYNREKYLFGEW